MTETLDTRTRIAHAIARGLSGPDHFDLWHPNYQEEILSGADAVLEAIDGMSLIDPNISSTITSAVARGVDDTEIEPDSEHTDYGRELQQVADHIIAELSQEAPLAEA